MAGALVISKNLVAEMATGEGKTITCAVAAVIKAWRGLGCHIMTVNDYLVKRDCLENKELYEFCGLKAGYVLADTNPLHKKVAYEADLTYLTHKVLLGDFLKDRLAKKKSPSSYLNSYISNSKHNQLNISRGLISKD